MEHGAVPTGAVHREIEQVAGVVVLAADRAGRAGEAVVAVPRELVRFLWSIMQNLDRPVPQTT